MPNTLAVQTLLPTGETLLTPPLDMGEGGSFRIILEGLFHFDRIGMDFDAVRQFPSPPVEGGLSAPFRYLAWAPTPPILESYEPAAHRAVCLIPAEGVPAGQSVGVRVDIDRFVDEFLITPGEVKAALSGQMRMTVLQTPVAVNPWPAVAWSALPITLAAVGISRIIRRRMALDGLANDLQWRLGEIETKYRSTCGSMRNRDQKLAPIQIRLATIRSGAYTLARQIQHLRNAQRSVDRGRLEQEAGTLEQQLATLPQGVAKQACAQTLVEKRRALALLEEMERVETGCALRLSRLEATMDTVGLTLRTVQVNAPETIAEDSVCRALDAEVSALYEANVEVAACETLQAQLFGT